MFEYDKASQEAAQKLDEYNLTELLSDCFDTGRRNLYDIEDAIIEKYPELDSVLEDLCSDELMEYIEKTYPVRFEEITSYHMYYTR